MAGNVGIADQVVRLVVGAGLLVLGLSHLVTGAWAIAAYSLGAIALKRDSDKKSLICEGYAAHSI
jgi:hypothetical protein